MLNHGFSVSHFRLTTIRSTVGRFDRRRYGVRVVGAPAVGRPMVMFGGDGNHRIVTSRVVRVFEDREASGTYVQTENTLYLLEH
jgi:hypothetical protein